MLMLSSFCWATSAAAQTFRVVSSTGDTIRQGDMLTLAFAFEDVAVSDFTLPDIRGLKLIAGPSRRSQISIVNGKRSSSESLIYRYLADKAGDVLVPAITVSTSTGNLSSAALRLYVTADKDYVSQPRVERGVDPSTRSQPQPRRRPTVKM